MSNFIYHYTTVENFALILSSSAIKFNSLNRVDDTCEAQSKDLGDLSEYVFASCWTKEREENIGLWSMYAKSMSGLRIGIDRDFLKPDIQCIHGMPVSRGKVKNITNPDINCLSYGFCYEVEYTDDYKFTLIKDIEEGKEIPDYIIDEAARYKKKWWAFQKEIRFIIHATTLNTNPGESDRLFYFRSILGKTNKTGLDSIFMKFDLSKLINAEITMGARSSEADKIIVESFACKYIPNFKGIICKSSLEIR